MSDELTPMYESEIREMRDRIRILEEELLRERRKGRVAEERVRRPAIPKEVQRELLPRAKQLQLPISRRGWHRSSEYKRTEHCEREKAFADAWEEENQEIPGLNDGLGILQHLTMVLDGNMTARDACVAASAVQWIGTNCGLGFLGKVIERSPGVRDSVAFNVRRGEAVHRDKETVKWCLDNVWKVAEAVQKSPELARLLRSTFDRLEEDKVEKRTAARRRAMIRRV